MDLSIIIVNYKTQDLTLQTLGSVFKAQSPKGKMEVILVDNGSEDNTPKLAKKKFPQLKVIVSSENLGFAGGNNLGMRKAKGRYVLLLNSDTLIKKDTLIKMVDFMDKHPKAGLATCRVNLFHGGLDPASHRGFPAPWAAFTYYSRLEKFLPQSKFFGQYHQGWKNLKTTHQIDSPTGAFFFLRKKALNQVGLLDEAFFMYAEDLDLAYRVKQAGWQIMFTPITQITHLKGASGLKKKVKQKLNFKAKAIRIKITKDFFQAMKIFYNKHYKKKYFFPLRWLVFFAIDLIKALRIFKIKLS